MANTICRNYQDAMGGFFLSLYLQPQTNVCKCVKFINRNGKLCAGRAEWGDFFLFFCDAQSARYVVFWSSGSAVERPFCNSAIRG